VSRQPSSRLAARGLGFQEISTVAPARVRGLASRLTSACLCLDACLDGGELNAEDNSESTCSLDVCFIRHYFRIYSIENRLKRLPTSLSVFIDDGASVVESIVRHPPTHDHS